MLPPLRLSSFSAHAENRTAQVTIIRAAP